MLKVFSATNETVHRLSVANGWNMANCSMSYWRCCRIQLQLQLQLAERTLLCAGHASVAFQLRSHLRNAAGGGVITTTMAAGMTISYRTAGRSLMSNNDFWYYERTDGRTDGHRLCGDALVCGRRWPTTDTNPDTRRRQRRVSQRDRCYALSMDELIIYNRSRQPSISESVRENS